MKTLNSFLNEMKDPTKMSDKQILAWLTKTHKSISKRGISVNINSVRGYELVDRYTELRDEAMERNIWKSFCKSNHSCDSHDAYDLFA